MQPCVLGPHSGYKPELYLNPVDGLIDVRVRGIPERIAKLPMDTRDAIVTADGYLFYTSPADSPPFQTRISMLVPDQRERVKQIVRECEESSTTRADPKLELADDLFSDTFQSIQMREKFWQALLETYSNSLTALQNELSAIKVELVALKAEAALLASQPQEEAIGDWTEGRGLRDGLTPMDDNPFRRR